MTVFSWWAFHRVGEFFVVRCCDDDLLQVNGDRPSSLLIARQGDPVVHPGRHICIPYFDIIFSSKKRRNFGDVLVDDNSVNIIYSNICGQERRRDQRLDGLWRCLYTAPFQRNQSAIYSATRPLYLICESSLTLSGHFVRIS